MEIEKISPEVFAEVIKEHEEKEREAEEERTKPQIHLPVTGKLISEFAGEVASILKKKDILFYRPSSKDILEIARVKEKERDEDYIGFSAIKPERFITLAEQYFTPVVSVRSGDDFKEKEKSMSSTIAKILLESSELQNNLKRIKRIFSAPIPIIYKEELTFPKKGYDERFESYTPQNAPDIDVLMSLDEAKQILNNVYGEFCFQDKQDFANAIAGLLTPFIRGLCQRMNVRTPVFIYIGNRERVGKDYCADITGIVFEGYALQEPPISSGEATGNNNEELRKKILSANISGRKRLHFANNKGYINNAVFEGVITSEKYSDRALGRNEILTFDNEIDFSLSGNVGITFTPDLANRSLMVRLFLDIEDANSRQFENPNLHNWVKENRGLILSALYTLVRNWVEQGCPNGTIPFASFPEWARICGGIMESAGYDNPCVRNKELLAIGGDVETTDMKILFEEVYKESPDTWLTKQEIKEIVQKHDLFSYLDFERKSDQTKFGQKINKFVGRILSDIKLNIQDSSIRASRQRFMFVKERAQFDKSQIGNLDNLGNLSIPPCDKDKDKYTIGKMLPTLPRLPENAQKKLDFEEKHTKGDTSDTFSEKETEEVDFSQLNFEDCKNE
jgi:hypothetical protein